MPRQRIKHEVSIDNDKTISNFTKTKTAYVIKLLIQLVFAIGFIIGALFALAPFLLQLYGDFIVTHLFFQNWSRYYSSIDYTKLDSFNLNGINVYEHTEPDVKVGIWYILPSTIQTDHNLPTLGDYLKTYVKSNDQSIVLYLHGQGGSRALYYRTNHYKMITEFDNHVITFDYRGFADSTGTSSVKGIIDDVLHVFKVIRKTCPDNPITIWGHSMGTGVASLAMHYLFQNHTGFRKPSGLVLQAPFYNVSQAFLSHPLMQILKMNPYLVEATLDSLEAAKLDFPNNKIISSLPLPIVVIHAEDDTVIPYFHLELIQDYVKKHRNPNFPPVRFVTIPHSVGCGHRYICSYLNLQDFINDFAFFRHTPPA